MNPDPVMIFFELKAHLARVASIYNLTFFIYSDIYSDFDFVIFGYINTVYELFEYLKVLI